MDLKIRNVPEDQVLVIQRKARKFESAVKNIYVELFKKSWRRWITSTRKISQRGSG